MNRNRGLVVQSRLQTPPEADESPARPPQRAYAIYLADPRSLVDCVKKRCVKHLPTDRDHVGTAVTNQYGRHLIRTIFRS